MAKKRFLIIIIPLATFVLGITSTWFYFNHFQKKVTLIGQSGKKVVSSYIAFTQEAYQIIQNNYWDKLSDDQLTQLFINATEKLTRQPQLASFKPSKSKYFDFFQNYLSHLPVKDKKQLTVQLVNLVLNSLQPPGRSKLYLKKDALALRNEVENKTSVDFYQTLGLTKKASSSAITKAYQKKLSLLKKKTGPKAKLKLQQLKQAYQTLNNRQSKSRYDKAKIATTVEAELITPEILHMRISRFSPTTLADIKRVSQKFDRGNQLDNLIIDLRDNIGGAIDGLPYFLGPFIGNNQYAYEFLHQGKEENYKTKIGWLPSLARYKKVVILINNGTQSSAEVFASVLKKYNVGVLVGQTTKGWGTIERVFPLKHQIDKHETYSIFLVHRLTLNQNNKPIEGKGVTPDIKISDPNWQKELYHYFADQQLITAVAKVWHE